MTNQEPIKNCFTCKHHAHKENYCNLGHQDMGPLQAKGIWICVRWEQDPKNVVYSFSIHEESDDD